MLDKIEVHEKLAKKVKQFNITTSVLSTGLITPTVNTRVASIAAFYVVMFVGIALSGTALRFFLQHQVNEKIFDVLLQYLNIYCSK